MARDRDYKAEYRARKAALAAKRTTLYRKRNAEAKRLGYKSLGDQRKRRKTDDLTHADQAAGAKRQGGKYVNDLGRGRWTFATPNRDPDPLTILDRSRLQQTLDRAWRADANVTITATWRDDKGRRGTAQAGGSYGVGVRGFHNEHDDAERSIETELALGGAAGKSELPAAAFLTSLSLFFFPAEGRAAA